MSETGVLKRIFSWKKLRFKNNFLLKTFLNTILFQSSINRGKLIYKNERSINSHQCPTRPTFLHVDHILCTITSSYILLFCKIQWVFEIIGYKIESSIDSLLKDQSKKAKKRLFNKKLSSTVFKQLFWNCFSLTLTK